MDLKCRLYDISGIPNMRDLGGYATKDGRCVVMGRFIRSTALNDIGSDAVLKLKELGIDCVIDLRSKLERKRAPDIIENHDGIHFVHVPMLDNIQSNFVNGNFSGDFPASMTEMYIGLLDNYSDLFKTIFEVFADKRFSHYLFHCTAGKDRTGVTAMLLLGLAGVPAEIIAEDYSYTRFLFDPTPVEDFPFEIPKYLFESAPHTMLATIRHIDERYGGIKQYLSCIGIRDGDMQSVLDKLLKE
ncbi:MAG: tyrosine-protein phosphatase [Oscillospiraceae bacterium]|nr:tyrosine-protein phosphatase [Oscillospiraceae bacterium]